MSCSFHSFHLFHGLPSCLSCSSFITVFNGSFLPLCETHLHCSAKGNAVTGVEEMYIWTALDWGAKREKERIRKCGLSFTKIMAAWVTGKYHFACYLLYYTILVLLFSTSFLFPFDTKTCLFKRPNSNTNTTICISKCCHREITDGVIHPHLPASLWASLLLMASSFFLCSLYFPSDSGACFIVFCHVSVIAPTACLMLSI